MGIPGPARPNSRSNCGRTKTAGSIQIRRLKEYANVRLLRDDHQPPALIGAIGLVLALLQFGHWLAADRRDLHAAADALVDALVKDHRPLPDELVEDSRVRRDNLTEILAERHGCFQHEACAVG